jgi:CO/xanthine dehydrogenase Mo-binding subunit
MAQNDLAGPIGRPLDRVDGPLKVTGRAKYAFEYASQGEATYGFIVSAPIAKGRVVGVDVRDAERGMNRKMTAVESLRMVCDRPPQSGPAHAVERRQRGIQFINSPVTSAFPVAIPTSSEVRHAPLV